MTTTALDYIEKTAGTVKLTEVSGERYADEVNRLNGLFPDDFVALKPRHLKEGFWWLAHDGLQLVGFAGMVPFHPFPRVGYLKRAAVIPAYRGRGLQQQMMNERVSRAKSSTDWTHFVTETHMENVASSNNMIRAGFRMVTPERPWAEETLFWVKEI